MKKNFTISKIYLFGAAICSYGPWCQQVKGYSRFGGIASAIVLPLLPVVMYKVSIYRICYTYIVSGIGHATNTGSYMLFN